MLGSFAVGKTSLVRRFVVDLYDDRYRTTVAVTVQKKTVEVAGGEVALVLYDLYGDDEFQAVPERYFHGMAGYLLVVDGCRRDTLVKASELQERVTEAVGEVPFVCALNKVDLEREWEVEAAELEDLAARGWRLQRTSALSGAGVEAAFDTLARAMVGA